MDTKDKVKLRSRAKLMEPLVRIGKNGLTDSVVEQVRRLLVKRELVKVKLLRAFIETNDRKKVAAELAKRTGSELIDQVGFAVVLYRRKVEPKPARPKRTAPARKSAINEVRSKAKSRMLRHGR
jgi:RNA-binding protein